MAARTGEQFLRGLAGRRQPWVGGDKVCSVVDHPALSGAAKGAGRGLRPSAPSRRCLPDARPRDRGADRRRPHDPAVAAKICCGGTAASERFAEYSRRADGPYARLHERDLRRLRRPGRRMGDPWQRAAVRTNLVALSEEAGPRGSIAGPHDRAFGRRYVQGELPVGLDPVQLHKVEETEHGIVVRGSRVLATLAPFADELAVYPGGPMPDARR